MEIQNDYRLLYLYHLADNEGKLKDKHKTEFERLKALYSIDKAKKDAKEWLLDNEHICSTEEGYLESGSWVLTKEDKENPFKITQKGLDALDKKVFESETARKFLERELLTLQMNELKYKEKIRLQEAVIRKWKLITAIVGIIGVGFSIFFALFSRF